MPSNNENRPGTFVKGSVVRVAQTATQVVQLRFDGWSRVEEQGDVSYRELQSQAKHVGIPANQSAEQLVEALSRLEGEGGPAGGDRPTPTLGEDSLVDDNS